MPLDIAKWLSKKKYDRALVALFNQLMKNDGIAEANRQAWKTSSNEAKWLDILETLTNEATKAIEIILEHSELKDLWQSSESYEDWVREVNLLKIRCQYGIKE